MHFETKSFFLCETCSPETQVSAIALGKFMHMGAKSWHSGDFGGGSSPDNKQLHYSLISLHYRNCFGINFCKANFELNNITLQNWFWNKFCNISVLDGIRKAPDTFSFLSHIMRAILSVWPKCSHRCVSLKETSLKPVQILKHTTKNSAEQTPMRTKWFKHIAI